MDVEQKFRRELMDGLGSKFICFEEVELRHALFTKRKIRADVVAIPTDVRINAHALAFEVKRPDQTWDYSKWSNAIRQASDYVYAKIETSNDIVTYSGRRISAAFMYPSPDFDPSGQRVDRERYVRPDCVVMVSGLFHQALHFRVGRAFWEGSRHGRELTLAFGGNRVWGSRRGLRDQGVNLITGTRPLGSQRIDVNQELDRTEH